MDFERAVLNAEDATQALKKPFLKRNPE